MSGKPSPLFLTVIGGLGTALLSPLQVSGQPVVVLAIPLAIAGALWFGAEAGFLIALAVSVLSGILIHSIDGWTSILYALAAGIGVSILGFFPKPTFVQTLLALIVASIAFELLLDVYVGQNLFLRQENILGTSPFAGIRVLANVGMLSIILAYWGNEKK